MGITHALHKFTQSSPEHIYVFGSAGQVVAKVDFGFLHGSHLVQGQMEAAVKLVDQAANFDEVVLLKAIDVVSDVVPHLCVEVTGAVRQRERQVEFTVLFRLGLLGNHDERSRDYLVFKARSISNVKIFHGFSARASSYYFARIAVWKLNKEWARFSSDRIFWPR